MTSFRFAFSAAATALLLAIPPAAARTPVPPQPLGNHRAWFGTSDYPAEALRSLSEGLVMFRLKVGTEGRAIGCEILISSRSPVLDEATCRLAVERAIFTPAIDADGLPAVGYYRNGVIWQIPNDPPEQTEQADQSAAAGGQAGAAPARP